MDKFKKNICLIYMAEKKHAIEQYRTEEKNLKNRVAQAEHNLVNARREQERVESEYRDLIRARTAPKSIGISDASLREKRAQCETLMANTRAAQENLDHLKRELFQLPMTLMRKGISLENANRSRSSSRSSSRGRSGSRKRSSSRGRSRSRGRAAAAESPSPKGYMARMATVNGNSIGKDLVNDLESAEASLDQARHDGESLSPHRREVTKAKDRLKKHMETRKKHK